jgi:hypothetical protein
MELSEFGQAYKENLLDLTGNDRRTIMTLRDLACENAQEAANVVEALRQHIKQVSWGTSLFLACC